MVGINNVSSSIATQLVKGQANEDEKSPATVAVDLKGTGESGKPAGAKKAEEEGGSGEPSYIQQMREMIKQLQKQLAEEQRQLAQIAAQQMDETSKATLLIAKQASIATLSGQIQAATAKLLEALTKTGGSSAGGMVSTQA